MAFGRTKVFSLVFPIGIALLLSVQVVINVKGVILVANVGENVTLPCNPDNSAGNLYWRKANYYIAAVDHSYPTGGLFPQTLDTRLSVSYKDNRSFMLYIRDVNFTDSAKYTCLRPTIPPYTEVYDLRVIGCSPCLVNLSQGSDPEGVDINCYLDHFNSSKDIPLNVTLNSKETKAAVIEGSSLTLTTTGKMLYDDIQVQFNPYNGASGNITCIVPAEPSLPSSTTIVTTYEPSTRWPNVNKFNSTVLMISIISSVIILILITIILRQQYYRTRDRAGTKYSQRGTNCPIGDESAGENYESLQGRSKKDPEYTMLTEGSKDRRSSDEGLHCQLSDNVLCGSVAAITESSFSCMNDQLDTYHEYAMPDEARSIDHLSNIKLATMGTPNSVSHYGNRAIIDHHKHVERRHPLKEGQYDDVESPVVMARI